VSNSSPVCPVLTVVPVEILLGRPCLSVYGPRGLEACFLV